MNLQMLIIVTLVSTQLVSCGLKKHPIAEKNRPAIYDAWDARYTYQIENRRMIPVHEGRMIGRSWGRDEDGKIDHVAYLGPDGDNVEDLLSLHHNNSDRLREKKWKKAKEQRIDFIRSQLELIEEEENTPLIEIEIEEEDEDFVPPVFIPQGIDLFAPEESTGKPSSDEDAMPLPFAPL